MPTSKPTFEQWQKTRQTAIAKLQSLHYEDDNTQFVVVLDKSEINQIQTIGCGTREFMLDVSATLFDRYGL